MKIVCIKKEACVQRNDVDLITTQVFLSFTILEVKGMRLMQFDTL